MKKKVEQLQSQSQCIALIRQVCQSGALDDGRRLHLLLAKDGSDQETFLGNLLVQMYSQCRDITRSEQSFETIRRKNLFSWSILVSAYAQHGHLDRAERVLNSMPVTNSVLWNTMISGHAKNGDVNLARIFFYAMPERDVASWNSMISAYALNGPCSKAVAIFLDMDLQGVVQNKITFLNVLDAVDVIQVKFIDEEICSRGLETDLVAGTARVKTYGRLKLEEQATQSFDQIIGRNIVSWNTLLEACSCERKFEKMPLWDLVTWTLMLVIYARDGHLQSALRIFISMPERSAASWNAILSGCIQNGALTESEQLFEMMPQRNVVTWTTMIFGGDSRRSLGLFREMDLEGLRPNRITFLSLIDGFGSLETLDDSKAVHECAAEEGHNSDPEIRASLIRMYGRCQSIEQARALFLSSDQSPFMYNAMLSALSGEDAFLFAREMDLEGVKLDKSSLISTIESCSSLARGKLLRSSIPSEIIHSDIALGTSLMYMFGRFGDVITARTIFENLQEQNQVSWTALIATYAQNGRGDLALEHFRYAGADGILPDSVTFAKILVACSHAGLVNHGCHFFSSFLGDYNLIPSLDHYNCLIDLLCRNGKLVDAQELASTMPFEPNLVSWVTLLGGCSLHRDRELGIGVAKQANKVDELNTAPYSLLANIHKS